MPGNLSRFRRALLAREDGPRKSSTIFQPITPGLPRPLVSREIGYAASTASPSSETMPNRRSIPRTA
jgi:hypothetical protein